MSKTRRGSALARRSGIKKRATKNRRDHTAGEKKGGKKG